MITSEAIRDPLGVSTLTFAGRVDLEPRGCGRCADLPMSGCP